MSVQYPLRFTKWPLIYFKNQDGIISIMILLQTNEKQ